jgi:formate dehydrogenase subunit gamma
MTIATKQKTDEISSIISHHLHLEGPLLPILHALQDTFGYIPASAESPITDALNITKAELHGVLSFYHDFTRRPVGAHVIKICQAEACQAVGAKALAQSALERLGKGWNETTDNGAVTIAPVYCLGMCACGPAVIVDDTVIGRMNETRLHKLLEEAGA